MTERICDPSVVKSGPAYGREVEREVLVPERPMLARVSCEGVPRACEVLVPERPLSTRVPCEGVPRADGQR